MKKLHSILAIYLLALSLAACTNEVNAQNSSGQAKAKELLTESKNNLLYIKYTNRLASGKVVFYKFINGNKKIKLKCNAVNGMCEGKRTGWYENGQKMSECNTINGICEGKRTGWYENGQNKSECNTTINGKCEGKQTWWHESGERAAECNNINDKCEGKTTSWHKNGHKRDECNYVNNKCEGKKTSWYKNGQKALECITVKGKCVDVLAEWDENGKIKMAITKPFQVAPTANFTFECTDLDCTFSDGSTDADGTIANYAWDFADGSTSTEASPTHSYTEYGDNTASLTVTDNNGATGTISQKVSLVRQINESQLEHLGDRVFGLKGEAKPFTGIVLDYHQNGKLKSKGTLINGRPNGRVITWHDNGQIYLERYMDNGEPISTVKEWNKDGKLVRDENPPPPKSIGQQIAESIEADNKRPSLLLDCAKTVNCNNHNAVVSAMRNVWIMLRNSTGNGRHYEEMCYETMERVKSFHPSFRSANGTGIYYSQFVPCNEGLIRDGHR